MFAVFTAHAQEAVLKTIAPEKVLKLPRDICRQLAPHQLSVNFHFQLFATKTAKRVSEQNPHFESLFIVGRLGRIAVLAVVSL